MIFRSNVRIMAMHILAIYDGDKMTKAFISENGRDIKNLPKTDLQNCKIFVWTKCMQPCIEAVNGDIAF